VQSLCLHCDALRKAARFCDEKLGWNRIGFLLSVTIIAIAAVALFEPNIGFVTLAVIFVAATLLGFASHAPGGIGVFDATMLVALWQFDKPELLAGLLLFRLLYYVAPFVLSLLILGGRELLLGLPGRAPGRRPPADGPAPPHSRK
jgi:uncharacterized membrane protein YbhN (UPF0104 family)